MEVGIGVLKWDCILLEIKIRANMTGEIMRAFGF